MACPGRWKHGPNKTRGSPLRSFNFERATPIYVFCLCFFLVSFFVLFFGFFSGGGGVGKKNAGVLDRGDLSSRGFGILFFVPGSGLSPGPRLASKRIREGRIHPSGVRMERT